MYPKRPKRHRLTHINRKLIILSIYDTKMVKGHKIRQKVEIDKFLEQIQGYDEKDFETTDHTFFHFSEKQRKTFNKVWLTEILLHENPFFVGIQYNNLWAAFYKYKKSIFRIILDIQANKVYIVTFYIIDESQIPRI